MNCFFCFREYTEIKEQMYQDKLAQLKKQLQQLRDPIVNSVTGIVHNPEPVWFASVLRIRFSLTRIRILLSL
jgi:hypothetical protein